MERKSDMYIYRILISNKFHTASLAVAASDEESALSAVKHFLESDEIRKVEHQELEWSQEAEGKTIATADDHRYATFGHPVEKHKYLDYQDKKSGSFHTRDLLNNPGTVIIEDSWDNG
jgi:hypothetical protein